MVLKVDGRRETFYYFKPGLKPGIEFKYFTVDPLRLYDLFTLYRNTMSLLLMCPSLLFKLVYY